MNEKPKVKIVEVGGYSGTDEAQKLLEDLFNCASRARALSTWAKTVERESLRYFMEYLSVEITETARKFQVVKNIEFPK